MCLTEKAIKALWCETSVLRVSEYCYKLSEFLCSLFPVLAAGLYE